MNEDLLAWCAIIIASLFNLPLFLDIFNKEKSNKDRDQLIYKIIMFFIGMFASLTCAMLLLMPIVFASEIDNNIVLSIYPIIVMTYIIIRLIGFITNYIKVARVEYDNIYVRDVFVTYSPAVLSLLLNHKIEDKKDFDATVLNIHSKKAIDFKKIGDKLEIVDLKNQKANSNLTEDEKYIYDTLNQKEEFNKQKWHDIIKRELARRGFVKRSNKSIFLEFTKICLLIFCATVFIFILFVLAVLLAPGDFFKNIATNYFNYEVVISIIWILILIPFQLGTLKLVMILNQRKFLKDKMDYYTEKGALEIMKWKKFEAFIKDYSMVDEVNAESVVIWEKYIAYSMALDINKSYNSNELKNINEIIKGINLFKLKIQ